MIQLTITIWVLILFGIITCLPLLLAQLVILIDPNGKRARDILVGKNEEWRDQSHFKATYALAWTDWLIFMPLFVIGIIGILIGTDWGFLLFAVSGSIQIYINVFLFFFEKEYVYKSIGPFKYYTYYWGNFIYWGTAALSYGIFRFIEH